MRYCLLFAVLTLWLTISPGFAQQVKPGAPVAAVVVVPPPGSGDALECQELTGRVTDEFAYPLTGATIMLRSPDKGFSPEAFSTNSEGHYLVTARQAIPRNTVMEITAVGYATLEMPLTSCKPLDLTLIPLITSYKAKFRAKKTRNNGRVQ